MRACVRACVRVLVESSRAEKRWRRLPICLITCVYFSLVELHVEIKAHQQAHPPESGGADGSGSLAHDNSQQKSPSSPGLLMGPLSEPIGSAEAPLTEQSSFHIGKYHVPPTPRFVRRSGAYVDKTFSQVRTRTRKSIMLERRLVPCSHD